MPIQIPKASKRPRRKSGQAEPTVGDVIRGDPGLLRTLTGPSVEEIFDALTQVEAFQARCRRHAQEILDLYWRGFDKPKRSIQLAPGEIADLLDPELACEPWFVLHLIQQAGERMLTVGTALQAAERASAKNRAARDWVLNEWTSRSDKGQSKAAFGRMYPPLIKKKFDLDVTPEQIAREWLPKGSAARD
jgi:hypothetical protein